MEPLKIFLFFLIPLIVSGFAVAVLQRLNENLEQESAAGSGRCDADERASATADLSAKKVHRAKVRKAEEPELPPEIHDYAAASPAQFEVPADFNLAEFSGRDEPQRI